MRTILKNLALPGLTACLFLLLNMVGWAQTSTVVIAEVMYDHPLYDNETVKTAHEGEFMTLYNYEEEDVDISGWRIEITDLLTSTQRKYVYTIPSNTILSGSGMAVIASRTANSSFDVLQFYGAEMPEETDGYFLLYTASLAFPDTRCLIRVYDAQNRIQDELVYDGKSDALANDPLLRATNTVNRTRPLSETVSIQREKIIIKEGNRIISRSDYYTADLPKTVRLFNYAPAEYTYTAPPSILTAGLPEDLSLSGTETKDKDYRTKSITSTQVIESGDTQYWAEEGIVLGPGFAVRDGAEFVAGVAPDSVHLAKILTYNLKGKSNHYTTHGKLIKHVGADVMSLQEVRGLRKFKMMKDESGCDGKRFCVIGDYGIGMLWNKSTVGEPIQTHKKLIAVGISNLKNDPDGFRGIFVAEFRDFCFVATHFSLDKDVREKMAKAIVGHDIVNDCIKDNKPVYVAGDLNDNPINGSAVQRLKDNGFVLLNSIERTKDSTYVDSTRQGGGMPDLVLGYNVNSNHKTIKRGVPLTKEQIEKFWKDKISDHLPYFVKIKLR